ncbi:MAG: hypothetical protein GXP29_06840, partial [Planctomycetes bacterium]|nr:hypothetical protein [Planctomycetota bacterium]
IGMSILIVDRHPSYLHEDKGATSLLMLPLGSRSYLDYIISAVGDGSEVIVVPTPGAEDDYSDRLHSMTSASFKVVEPSQLGEVLSGFDAESMVLVIDAGQCPTTGFREAVSRIDDCTYRGATHVIAMGDGTERARERIVRDPEGHVRHVQRLFQGASWPQVANTQSCMTLAPADALSQISFSCLADLRTKLGRRGVLQRDVPLRCGVVDLHTQEDALQLAELLMAMAFRRAHRLGYSRKGKHVLVGRDCWVDKSARLIGPVIVHDDVIVEENATIIGPTVVGSGSRIGANSVVAQSVLAGGAVVEENATVRHLVSSGGESKASIVISSDTEEIFKSLDFDPYDSMTGMEGSAAEKLPAHQKRVQMGIKRAIDAVVSLGVLIVFAPLLLIVAVIIKLESRGPLFFVHHRESKGGKEFPCLKFRTMVKGAHAQQKELYAQSDVDGPQFKIDDDPRVTRVGAFLRATNIDEIPQFFNVLLGQMSIIGPRPSPFRENQVCVPWRRARLSVRPGITGLWQICRSPDRSGGDFHEWIFYDTIYVKQFSLWLDVKIFAATLLTLGGRWSVPPPWIVRVHPYKMNQLPNPSTAQAG